MNRGIWLIGLAALPLGAQAQQTSSSFDYTFVDASYIDSESSIGPFDVDGDGLALRGSYALGGRVFLFGDYITQDHDGGVDTSLLQIGAGLRHPLQSNLDFVGELGWARAEVDTPFGDADDDGIALAGGLRFRANDNIEIDGMIQHLELDDSNTSLLFRGRYYFSPSLALLGGLLLDDGDTGWSIGIRASFGR